MTSTYTLYKEEENVGGGWSFIQELANPCQYPKKCDNGDGQVYVHPLVTLNEKSLEMCTESLGSETGSDIGDNIEEFGRKTSFQGSKCREMSNKYKKASSFPPPLSSMSGNEGVQVRPHRENGRLVLTAVAVSSSSCCFQAERVDGRLRLSLLKKNYSSNDDSEDEIQEHENDDSIKLAGEYGRRSRCKASGSRNKGIISSWEPFLVPIS